MIPLAKGKAFSSRESLAAGIAAIISATGSRQPMTPVEQGRTAEFPPSSPSALATPSQTSSLAATPSPAGNTLEILLFTTTACSGFPSASLLRPTMTGAPGMAFLVKTAAQSSVGLSRQIRFRFMGRTFPVISAGENLRPAAPTRKPWGNIKSASCWENSSSEPHSRVSCTPGCQAVATARLRIPIGEAMARPLHREQPCTLPRRGLPALRPMAKDRATGNAEGAEMPAALQRRATCS
mmetsp:Transcript_40050/g.87458  ORF Transcript_40050/g.87458 Transcript_40050/m.87458 type:complete len:238 (+) Transcript_40050:893-1606(+)